MGRVQQASERLRTYIECQYNCDSSMDVRLLAASRTRPADLAAAAGYLFVCPENLASMSGAMKEMLMIGGHPTSFQPALDLFTEIVKGTAVRGNGGGSASTPVTEAGAAARGGDELTGTLPTLDDMLANRRTAYSVLDRVSAELKVRAQCRRERSRCHPSLGARRRAHGPSWRGGLVGWACG